MLRAPRLAVLACGAALAVGAAGCKDDDDDGPPPNTTTGGTTPAAGTVNLLVTDEPYPYGALGAARVTITSIALRGAGVAAVGTQASVATVDSSGFAEVFTGVATVDLTQLRNGLTTTLGSVRLQPGVYDQARVVFTTGEVALVGGSTFRLDAPRGDGGTTVVIDPPLIVTGDGSTHDLLLDVDLARTFLPRRQGVLVGSQPVPITDFDFQPTIRVVALDGAGRISGQVLDSSFTLDPGDDAPLPFATVRVSRAGVPYSTTQSAADGRFTFIGLPAGVYEVSAEADGFPLGSAPAVIVDAGGTQGSDVRLTGTTR